MLTLSKQNLLAVVGVALLGVAMLFSFVSVAHATTYSLEEDGSYYSQSGSFYIDSDCGLRDACKWEYNEQYDDDNWLRWNFYAAHDYYDEHFHYDTGFPYTFIPTRGTTQEAEYLRQTWVYDWPYAPYLDNNWYQYGWFDQSAYLNSWVSLGAYGDDTEIYRLKLGDGTSETTSWYTVVWDATKSVY